MNETALAVNKKTGEVTQAMSAAQIDLIKKTVAVGATDLELQLFMYQANRTGLDPLTRQIHFVKRKTYRNGQWEEVATIQTGIDGFRAIADRTGNYGGSSEPVYTYKDDGMLESATVRVIKLVAGKEYFVGATAFYDEFVQAKDGKPFHLWSKMPRVMLAKCAESAALRKAFPNDLSGLYTHEEMMQADAVEPEPAKTAAEPPKLPATQQKAPQATQTATKTQTGKDKPDWSYAQIAYFEARKAYLAKKGIDIKSDAAKAEWRGMDADTLREKKNVMKYTDEELGKCADRYNDLMIAMIPPAAGQDVELGEDYADLNEVNDGNY